MIGTIATRTSVLLGLNMDLYESLKAFILNQTPDNLLTSLRKSYYLRKLKNCSESDEIDLKMVGYLVQSGDSVIDVGANFGVYTSFLSRLVGYSGHVYSIEPIPSTFEILANNVNRLNLQNVTLLNCGISDKNGFATMEIPKYLGGRENFYRARITGNADADASLKKVRVVLRTLDDISTGIKEDIKLIKIDVEGHELPVIEGAVNLIRRWQPALLIEVSDNPDDENSMAFTLVEILKKVGYMPYWFDGDRAHARIGGDEKVNYFFLTDQHLRGKLSVILQK